MLLESALRADAARALVNPLYATDDAIAQTLNATSYAHKRAIEQTIADSMRGAARTSLLSDEQIYGAARVAGLVSEYVPLAESATLEAVLQQGIANATDLTNLVRTSAVQSVRSEFTGALDKALLGMTSGVVPSDKAIREAVRTIASKQSTVSYLMPDGTRIEQNIYSAVRRAVITGSNQTTARMQDARMEEVGAKHVEVTAHAGARASHAGWQGKVYLRSDLVAATGYGSGEGLAGWNCRHSFSPFFPEIMEPTDHSYLEGRDAEHDYELSQQQRLAERNIRKYQTRSSSYTGVLQELKGTGRAPELRTWARNERDRNAALATKWRGEAQAVSEAREGARRFAREAAAPRL